MRRATLGSQSKTEATFSTRIAKQATLPLALCFRFNRFQKLADLEALPNDCSP